MSRLEFAGGVVADLGREWGLEGIALDYSGRLGLSFDDMAVNLSYAAAPVEALWLTAELGDLERGNLGLLQFLLETNMKTSPYLMTLCLTDDGKRAVGVTMIPLAVLTVARIKAVMEQVVQEGLAIREEAKKAAMTPVPRRDDVVPSGPVIRG